jgi:CelD/BcsL family acetyltransferase involved in cellulose biosynthesis
MAPEERLKVQTHESVDQVEDLRAEWENLLAQCPQATTFSTLEWLLPWWKVFGCNDELRVLTFSDASSTLVGVAPLALTRRRCFGTQLRVLRLMGDGSGDSDNLDIPVRPGSEKKLVHSLLCGLEQLKLKDQWDFCELNTLPSTSTTAELVLEGAKHRGWSVFHYPRVASAIELPDSWELYQQQLSSEDRKNLGRYARRLEKRYQVRIFRCSQEQEIPACLEALFKLHQLRWSREAQTGTFNSHERRQFYDQLCRSLLARGWLQFWMLELDGSIAAAQFGFRYRGTVFQLQEGNDPDRSSDRIGFVLRGFVLQQLIAEGVRVYDFLGGQLGYKARWGATERYYSDLKLARPFSLGAAYLRAVHESGRTKEWLRQSLPKSAWKTLHAINVNLLGRKKARPSISGGDVVEDSDSK